MDTPDLSIAIVHWNVPELLDACLSSIRRETEISGLRTETIVVDNASDTPELRRVLDAHVWAQPIFLHENRGYAAGCNAALAVARGAATLLLNPDTEMQQGAFRALWNTLHAAAHIGMVAPLLLYPDGRAQSAGYHFPGLMNVICDLFPVPARIVESPLNGRQSVGDGVSPYRIDYPLGAAMCVRRAAWEDVGPLDEQYGMYCEEIDWAERFAQRGWTILLAPSAHVIHHSGQSTQQRRQAMQQKLWESRLRYYERWGTSLERALVPRVVRARIGSHIALEPASE